MQLPLNTKGKTCNEDSYIVLKKPNIKGHYPTNMKPNRETVLAIQEAKHILLNPNAKKYSDVEEALIVLKK